MNSIFLYGICFSMCKDLGVKDFVDLVGKMVVMMVGMLDECLLCKFNEEKVMNMMIISVKDYVEVFMNVMIGCVVVFVMDELLLYGEIVKDCNLGVYMVIGMLFVYENYVCMMCRDDLLFKCVVDGVIVKM